MKKLLLGMLFICGICHGADFADTARLSVPAASTIQSVKHMGPEAYLRCHLDPDATQNVASTLAFKKDDWTLKRLARNDPLPPYKVNGLTVKRTPVDKIIQQLVHEAGITVYVSEDAYPTLSTNAVYGPLNQVLDSLASAGEFFYDYDSRHKILRLSKYAQFEITMPQNTMLMLGVLDAFRGAGLVDVNPNWNEFVLSVMLTQEQLVRAQKILTSFLTDGYLLLADVQVYAIDTPAQGINWQKFMTEQGIGQVYATSSGLLGKIITTGHQATGQSWAYKLSRHYPLQLVSQGVAMVPNRWRSRFDIGRCAISTQTLNPLALLMSAQVNTKGGIEMTLTLDSSAGEISSFSAFGEKDENMAVIGIPAQVIGFDSGELLITLKLRFIRFIQEKENNLWQI